MSNPLQGEGTGAPRDGTSSASCAACIAKKLSLCADIRGKAAAGSAPVPAIVGRSHTVPARQVIYRPGEWSEFVTFICKGWAAVSTALPDGRRQIISFLLSGDIISFANLFDPIVDRLTESVTVVTYRNFDRREFTSKLRSNPDSFNVLADNFIQLDSENTQLILDLGRRTAEERIARMILVLADRLAKRGFARGSTIEFPLRQHHIGDAAGLTPVHVGKVLSAFRRSRLIEIEKRSLAILDPVRLRRVATLQ